MHKIGYRILHKMAWQLRWKVLIGAINAYTGGHSNQMLTHTHYVNIFVINFVQLAFSIKQSTYIHKEKDYLTVSK